VTVLLVTAVESEREAALRGFERAGNIAVGPYIGATYETPAGLVHAFTCGVGPVAAAVAVTRLLATGPGYRSVINAGIAGGFRGRIEIGDLAVADASTYADLGARTEAGPLTLREMGIAQDSSLAIGLDQQTIARVARTSGRVVTGELLTLSCMTGTEPDADELARRFPRAIAEAMEGFGAVAAASDDPAGPFVMEIRSISNLVGRRDRSTWNIPLAFDALADAVSAVLEGPLP
jgi:futalosine hydrolase